MSALVIDEAQCLPDELLEEIRLLANIESASEKLLSIVLAGQPELADRLNQPSLRQLKQRIGLRCTLTALDPGGDRRPTSRRACGSPAARSTTVFTATRSR